LLGLPFYWLSKSKGRTGLRRSENQRPFCLFWRVTRLRLELDTLWVVRRRLNNRTSSRRSKKRRLMLAGLGHSLRLLTSAATIFSATLRGLIIVQSAVLEYPPPLPPITPFRPRPPATMKSPRRFSISPRFFPVLPASRRLMATSTSLAWCWRGGGPSSCASCRSCVWIVFIQMLHIGSISPMARATLDRQNRHGVHPLSLPVWRRFRNPRGEANRSFVWPCFVAALGTRGALLGLQTLRQEAENHPHLGQANS